MVTSYDSWSAALAARSSIDCLLVGDSAAMVMHGLRDTTQADAQMIALHTRAVRRGAPDAFVISDMPFLSCRKGLHHAMDTVEVLMKAGADAVKIEGLAGQQEIIGHIIESGVPVMGHLGLTPQSVHILGGYKVQGRTDDAGEAVRADARSLQEIGCFSLVVECVPARLAEMMADELTIPVIGIGAGAAVDGQVLVLQDLLGMSVGHTPKFVRKQIAGAELIIEALNTYVQETKTREFPSEKESYA